MRHVLLIVTLIAAALCPVAVRAQKASVDACSLLTASEAGTALGVTVTQGHHLIEPQGSMLVDKSTTRRIQTIAGSRC